MSSECGWINYFAKPKEKYSQDILILVCKNNHETVVPAWYPGSFHMVHKQLKTQELDYIMIQFKKIPRHIQITINDIYLPHPISHS